MTQILVRDLTEVVPIVSANAQRANSEVKINISIAYVLHLVEARRSLTSVYDRLGMKRYWKGLALSTNWNFNDPENLLNGPEFVNTMKILTQLTPDDTETKSWFGNVDDIQTLVGVGTGIAAAAAAGPTVAAIGLSVFLTRWIAKAYDNTPEALRCFMGYIVDLTLVLDQLFLVTFSTNIPRPLTMEDITTAVENYKRLHMASVHREIRQYVNKATFQDILHSNQAELKVKDLLKKYCAKGTGASGGEVSSS
ncbi:hypothetical protein C8R44DRAFT_867330 [Mycena epipterygia]|nr:hypothetical protein C8R44DRAFT_867330 [Mycena epipterygia]